MIIISWSVSRKNLKYLDILLLFRSSECHHNRWNFCQNCVRGWQSHSRVYRDGSPATANPVVPCRWSIARGINHRRWIPAYPERPAFTWRYIQMWSHQQSWLCTVSGHHLCARFVLIYLFLVWLVVWPTVCLFACSLFFCFFFSFSFSLSFTLFLVRLNVHLYKMHGKSLGRVLLAFFSFVFFCLRASSFGTIPE